MIAHRSKTIGAIIALGALLMLTACAGDGSSTPAATGKTVGIVAEDGTVTPPPSTSAVPAEAQAALDEFVPKEMHAAYDQYWTFATLGANPYADWTPPTGKVKYCLSDTFVGNTWRQGFGAKFAEIVDELDAAGKADGPLVTTNADGNINVHQSQINQLVSQGCDVIWSFPAGPTGICPAVTNAHDNGVLFITVDSPIDCEDALNIGFNEPVSGGSVTATALVNLMGGSGNVLLLNGIPGYAVTKARGDAAKAVFAEAGIEIAGEVQGDYTASTAKSAVLNFLATHPEPIDAVWDMGAMSTAAAQAFQQSGRDLPTFVNFAADCSWMGFWKDNDLTSFSVAQGPRTAAQEAANVTARLLAGEQPKANLLLYPLPQISQQLFPDWYKSDMTVDSTCFAEPEGDIAVPDSYFDPMFQ